MANNATNANIARNVLLLATPTKPIFLTLILKSFNWPKKSWVFVVWHEYWKFQLPLCLKGFYR